MASGQMQSIAPIWMVNLEVERRNRSQNPEQAPTQTVSQQNLAQLSGQGGMPQQPGGQGGMPQQAPVMAARGGVIGFYNGGRVQPNKTNKTDTGNPWSSNPIFRAFDPDWKRYQRRKEVDEEVLRLRNLGLSDQSIRDEIMSRGSMRHSGRILEESLVKSSTEPIEMPMQGLPVTQAVQFDPTSSTNITNIPAIEQASQILNEVEQAAVAGQNNPGGRDPVPPQHTLPRLQEANDFTGQLSFQERMKMMEDYAKGGQEQIKEVAKQQAQGPWWDRAAGGVASGIGAFFNPENASLISAGALGVSEAANQPGQSFLGSVAGISKHLAPEINRRRELAIQEQNAQSIRDRDRIMAEHYRRGAASSMLESMQRSQDAELGRRAGIQEAEILAGGRRTSNVMSGFQAWLKNDPVAARKYTDAEALLRSSKTPSQKREARLVMNRLLQEFYEQVSAGEVGPFAQGVGGGGGNVPLNLNISGGWNQ